MASQTPPGAASTMPPNFKLTLDDLGDDDFKVHQALQARYEKGKEAWAASEEYNILQNTIHYLITLHSI